MVRYAAAQGLLRHPAMAGPRCAALTTLSLGGQLTSWVVVRRRHNQGVDALATHALGIAVGLRGAGERPMLVMGNGWPQQLAYPA